jgi:hypothetical protein
MENSLCLALAVLTPQAVTGAGEPFTTSMGQIIETRGKIKGGKNSWSIERRDLRSGEREGLIKILESPHRKIRYDPFRSPVTLAWTEAGLFRLEDMRLPRLVPLRTEDPPAWLPRRDPAKRNLNPKAKAIMDTLQGLLDCSDQESVHPSVDWIMENSDRFHGEPMARSTFFAQSRWLEWYGFLRRATRKRTLDDGTITNDTTLYYIAAKAWELARLAYVKLKKHFSRTEVRNSGLNKVLNSTDIGGDGLSTDSSPPLLKIEGAPSASSSLRGPSTPARFTFESLIPASGR